MNGIWLVGLTITGSIGVALMFVGVLMVLLTAFGNKHYLYGALFFVLFIVPMVLGRGNPKIGFLMLLLLPVTLTYCYQHRLAASYANKLLLPGAGISLFTVLAGWLLLTYGVTPA